MMTTEDEQYIWYASYGSNLNIDRFLCYIQGGQPIGSLATYEGCDDKTPPRAEALIDLPGQIYFAFESSVWTGGMAFLSHATSATVRAKAYLVTSAQFAQIVMQENHLSERPTFNIDELRNSGHVTLGRGKYDQLIYFGDKDGYPIVSFTHSVDMTEFAKPVPSYLKIIAGGLMSTYSMAAREVADYLITAPGIAGNYTHDELVAALSDENPIVVSAS